LAGRGPFSVEENRRHIRQFHVGVLVTKDRGRPGGTTEKLAAARAEGCRVIVVERPAQEKEHVFGDIDALLQALAEVIETETAE
jgi:precorrin-6A/cobalt-precorrin-6A reductase